ncbi:hypothetical protein [Prosthecobacter sp.]|uniref:hypothetical protein n=1 Tax=Prosthecobacter sp. TaxID=1965333 RepID=UPI003784E220
MCRNHENGAPTNHPVIFAMNSPSPIVIADNQPAGLADFREALEAQADLSLAAAVTCASCVFSAVSRQRTELLILSLSMPGHRILQLAHDLTVLHPHLKLLIIASPHQHLDAAHVMRAGVHGCVPAGSSTAAKLAAVRKVLAGEHVFTLPQLADSRHAVALPLAAAAF